MANHDGKDPACPIVQKHSKEGIEWICKIKRSKMLVNKIKIVHIIKTDENRTQNLPFLLEKHLFDAANNQRASSNTC